VKEPESITSARIPGLGLSAEVEQLAWHGTSVVGVDWLPLALEGGAEGRSRGGGAVLIRMAPGCGYPAHRHLGLEHVLVLQGGYADDHGEHRVGDYVAYPAGSDHAPVALGDARRPSGPDNPACILYTALAGGIELLEADEVG